MFLCCLHNAHQRHKLVACGSRQFCKSGQFFQTLSFPAPCTTLGISVCHVTLLSHSLPSSGYINTLIYARPELQFQFAIISDKENRRFVRDSKNLQPHLSHYYSNKRFVVTVITSIVRLHELRSKSKLRSK